VAQVLTAKRAQELVAHPQQFGAQCPRTDLGLGRDQLDRNDEIAFDLQHAAPSFGRDARAPLSLRTEVATIADDERDSLRQAQRHIVGVAETDGKAEPPLSKGVRGLGEPFEHKGVMPRVRFRVGGGQTKTDDHRQSQPVCAGNRHFERRVELGPLRVLHPV
jgi:hypothetical protein